MTRALVKQPSANFPSGLTSQDLGTPSLELTQEQHRAYLEGLKSLGVEVLALEADEHPDSCFVEDMAVVVPDLENPSRGTVVLTNSPVRAAEQPPVAAALRNALLEYSVATLHAPGRLEGGDVLRLGPQFFVGLTERTNRAGFEQFQSLVNAHGYRAHAVDVANLLHLKTGASPLQENTVLALPQLAGTLRDLGCQVIEVAATEWHAANTVCVGRGVLVPAGHPQVVADLTRLGYTTVEVNLSEFKKQDGGASCLSILLPS